MRAKVILGFVLLLVALVVTALLSTVQEEPVEVSGNLSPREIADIRWAIRQKIYPPILPDLSKQSFRAAPGRLRDRFVRSTPRIWKIEQRTQQFVAVIGRLPQDEPPQPCMFWGVLRETNNWYVVAEYRYQK